MDPRRETTRNQSRAQQHLEASSEATAAAAADQYKLASGSESSSNSPTLVSGGDNNLISAGGAAGNQNQPTAVTNKQRRSRTSFTNEQIEILEQHYQVSTYPNVPTRERLARLTKLNEARIQVSSNDWRLDQRAPLRHHARQILTLHSSIIPPSSKLDRFGSRTDAREIESRVPMAAISSSSTASALTHPSRVPTSRPRRRALPLWLV